MSEGRPTISQQMIDEEIESIAKQSLAMNIVQSFKDYIHSNHSLEIPRIKHALNRTPQQIEVDLVGLTRENVRKLSAELSEEVIRLRIAAIEEKLTKSLENGSWREVFQGKNVFNQMCKNLFDSKPARVASAYVEIALSEKPEVLQEIVEIFQEM